MNFRGFASKIKTSAAQAAAKLPTFDDMAAKDDYIHSEEFNISGQKRPNNKESSTTAATTTRPETKPQSAEIEESSSVSSWSLLDRPVPVVRAALPTPSQTPLVRPNSIPKPKTSQHDRMETSSQSIVSSLEHEDEEGSQTSGSGSSDNSYNSDDEYDEDDPIMSMIRKPSSKASNKKKEKNMKPKAADDSSSKKSSRRFLDDLDDRLSTPESRMEAGVVVGQSETYSPPPPVANRWGWVNSMAKEKMGQMLGRPVAAAQSSSAPLARKKPEVKAAVAPKEDDFHVASSTAVLADDELAELAKMKRSMGMMDQLCMLLDSLKENRQFVFIAFTMLLAAAVFFFTRHRSIEDDVT